MGVGSLTGHQYLFYHKYLFYYEGCWSEVLRPILVTNTLIEGAGQRRYELPTLYQSGTGKRIIYCCCFGSGGAAATAFQAARSWITTLTQDSNRADRALWAIQYINCGEKGTLQIQSLVKSIRDLRFSRGPSVALQPHLPRKQVPAQNRPMNSIQNRFLSSWDGKDTISGSNSNYNKFVGCPG